MRPSLIIENQKLKTERKQQGWSQTSLAAALGVTTRTVIRWERGQSVPHPNHRRKLGTILGKTAEELGLSWDAYENSLTVPVLWPIDPIIPRALVNIDDLLGTAGLFIQLKKHLLEGESLVLTAEGGLLGIGQTTLALALTNDKEVQTRFRNGILWAPLGPKPHLLSQLMRWGKLLGVASSDVEAPESCQGWSRALRSAIGSRQMLLIIDDVWTTEDALALQIGGPKCTYLVTTCQPQVAFPFAQPHIIVVVPRLEEAAGLALLACHAPQLVQQDPEGALALIQSLNGLPLALTLMGNYLSSSIFSGSSWPLRIALDQLHNIEDEECLHMNMLATFEEEGPSLAEMGPPSLYAAIALCAQQLSPQAHAALCALAVFPPKPHTFSEEAALVMSREPIEILNKLCNAGLVERWGPERYTLHQAVVTYARARAKP